jgi:hypothetical protein
VPGPIPLDPMIPVPLWGVLVLARPSAREDGTAGPRKSPKGRQENPTGISGEPKKTTRKNSSKSPDRAAAAVSITRVNEV